MPNRRELVVLAAITLLGLAMRLLVWRWREFQPLGGDEQEYLGQALTLLRERQYVELRLMRPPLYTGFLAVSILAVDSLVQNLRLVQALVGAATVPLVYLLTREVGGGGREVGRAALLAAGLCALSYTLAANATELLTETLFLFGLTATLWLLLRAGRLGAWPLAALAGLALGALCLVRSVGLPLLPLGMVWLAAGAWGSREGAKRILAPTGAFALAALLVILPWTARNYVVYGGVILIDTTGAENLWLDNDPAGREAVKAQLYALGEDRLLRQQLGSRQGLAAIMAEPGRFGAKAWGELLKFFALEQADDMLARRAIWVSPAEIWARLLLGDALWLALLLLGGYGLARAILGSNVARSNVERSNVERSNVARSNVARSNVARSNVARSNVARSNVARSSAWLLAPWALYVLVTTLIFHVELRYRLPLYPGLLSYAALVMTGSWGRRGGGAASGVSARGVVASLVPLACLLLTLLHAPYPALAWRLGWKHWHLAWAEAALGRGGVARASDEAGAALGLDHSSALARVALARVDLAEGDLPGALESLDAAAAAVPDHPQTLVLRGDVRRALGDEGRARADLAFEAASRQDLQRWLWERGATPLAPRLDLGRGLDLGMIGGFHAVWEGEEGFRWTTDRARLRLEAPPGARELALRLASGRPAGSPPVPVEVWAGGERVGLVEAPPDWAEVSLVLPTAGGELIVELRQPTFSPRQLDQASPDGRQLGVKLAWAEVR